MDKPEAANFFLAYLDEADHTAKNDFTACGLTAIPTGNAGKLSSEIEVLRKASGAFSATDLLKFAVISRPPSCTPSEHRDLKEKVVHAAYRNGAVFFGYCKFNDGSAPHDADRNRLYGFNTLLGKYDKFLKSKSCHGIAFFDRLDLSKRGKLYKNGFEYLKEKFQLGNDYSGTYKPLDNILTFGMSCEGSSHLQSVNDILTGSLRYLANGTNPTARKALQSQLQKVMWKDSTGSFKEHGFTLRPYVRTKLSPSVVAEYDNFRAFLNSKTP